MATKQIAPAKKPKSLDENIKHLRSILSVDTIIEDINQEEALEFLEAIEGDIETEREEMKDALNAAELKVEGADKLIIKLKDAEIDDDQAKDLLDIIKDESPEAIYDFVRSEGYAYIKVETMVDQEKLRNFIETELYPHYNQQQGDNYLL